MTEEQTSIQYLTEQLNLWKIEAAKDLEVIADLRKQNDDLTLKVAELQALRKTK